MLHLAHLASRALVRVSGPDARPFLNNLLTQEVETWPDGELRFGALLSPPGRLLFDLLLFPTRPDETEGVILDVAADRRDALIQRLSMYRLRARVEIAADDGQVHAAWGDQENTPGEGFHVDPRTPLLGRRSYGDAVRGALPEDDYDAHRLSVGVPDPARDAVSDKTYPIEANFDLLSGIDFHKGCFVGQETTSRMRRRGAIRNRMLPIDFDGPRPDVGAEVLNGDRRAGEVMTGRPGSAMALLRLDRLPQDQTGVLTVDGQPVRVRWPTWMPPVEVSNAPD